MVAAYVFLNVGPGKNAAVLKALRAMRGVKQGDLSGVIEHLVAQGLWRLRPAMDPRS